MERLFRYDHWANRETLASLRAIADPPPRAVRLMAHIVGTQWLWLNRLRGGEAAVWPDLTLDEIAAQLDQLASEWRAAPEAAVLQQVSYTNSKGEPWTSSAPDILMHVILHGVHHRGQIATILRDAGHEPAYTDFIHAARNGFV